MNVDFKGVEVGGLACATSSTTFVAGRAVGLLAGTGVSTPLASSRVLGLIKEHMIAGVLDEVNGQFGIYGAKKATVLMEGVATIQQSVINGISYSVYNQALTYAIGDILYATPASGVLTNAFPTAGSVVGGLTSSRVGRVLKAPANPANGDPMQLTVSCGL